MPNKYIGHDYTTPDLVAKVTGRAKYAEDFRAEGMLFCKLLGSPRPHARVRRIDASAALAMPGVVAILTADDLPALSPPGAGRGGERGAAARGREGAAPAAVPAAPAAPVYEERALTNEPLYEGEPILAVAAVDEVTAADAIEKIRIEFETLPHVVDPLESLKPNGPNARPDGNAYVREGGRLLVKTVKWTAEDFRELAEGRLPMGTPGEEWSFGDLEAGFRQAALVLDETLVQQSTSHQPLESRTAMAYWRNGKLYLHGSTQSTVQTIASVARWVGVPPSQVVIVSEYTGGGFGSKIPGSHTMAIPALLAKKTGRPVMMRITRREENVIGRARAGFQARVKIGFRKDGRVTALDMYIVQDNGPYARQGDFNTAAANASLAYQPLAMRFRGISVLTNTPPRTSQRAPGGLQMSAMMEPLLDKAARKLSIDPVEIRKINAPSGKARFGPPDPKTGEQRYVTSALVREALDRGAALFGWEERKRRIGQRRGSKVIGVGVGVSPFTAGSIGFDGLMTIRPDGKLYVQSGVGNLGTHSCFDLARVACEVLDFPFEKTVVTWGDTSKDLPWTCISAGSQTTHAMSRANYAAALDAKRKLQEIAARDLGGRPEDYVVGGERVFRKGQRARGLTFAKAAERAIALGGKFDGHELPANINPLTKGAASRLAGKGLMGVARDSFPRDGASFSYVVGFAEVEVDVETGEYKIVDFTAVADCGTIMNPRSLGAQILGGCVQGMGHARSQKWVYDQRWGLALAKRFYSNMPPTILDVPLEMKWAALNIADPETPVGARGIGEPPVGAGAAAVLCALASAVGDDLVRRAPITPDLLVMGLETGKVPGALTAHL